MSNTSPLAAPRKQHYAFAHLAFRALIESSPMHVLMTLLSKELGKKLLHEIWDQVGKDCNENERADSVGLGYQIHELSRKRPVVLIEMPTPRGVREAYYTATVITPPRRRFFLFRRPAHTQYFTLEIGNAEQGDFDTVLGQWCGEAHWNYSDSPAIDAKSFLQAVVRVLKSEISPQGVSNHPTRV